jgi:hypothetical protein
LGKRRPPVTPDKPPDDQDNAPGVFELRTAAKFLRVTPEALRKRIARGKVEGWKEGGRWLVRVDTSDRPTAQPPQPSGDVSAVSELYERLIASEKEATRYKLIAETSESTYHARIAELELEKAALEAKVRDLEQRSWWRRLTRGK